MNVNQACRKNDKKRQFISFYRYGKSAFGFGEHSFEKLNALVAGISGGEMSQSLVLKLYTELSTLSTG